MPSAYLLSGARGNALITALRTNQIFSTETVSVTSKTESGTFLRTAVTVGYTNVSGPSGAGGHHHYHPRDAFSEEHVLGIIG